MKLSAITDEISQDFEHSLDVLMDYSVRWAELRGLWGINIADLNADQLARAKSALNERGIAVCCLSTPLLKCSITSNDATVQGPLHQAVPRSWLDQIELLNRCAETAHHFETPLLRVFSFWKEGNLTDDIRSRIVDALVLLTDNAKRLNVTLVLENEHACWLGSGAETAAAIARVNSPALRACWDPGNAYMVGELPFPAGFRAVEKSLAHMHVKDCIPVPGGEPKWCVMGEGDIDYIGQWNALSAMKYTGVISLETHARTPAGDSEEPSRQSLSWLRNYIKD